MNELQRYSPEVYGDATCSMEQDDLGGWVSAAQAALKIAELEAEVERMRAERKEICEMLDSVGHAYPALSPAQCIGSMADVIQAQDEQLARRRELLTDSLVELEEHDCEYKHYTKAGLKKRIREALAAVSDKSTPGPWNYDTPPDDYLLIRGPDGEHVAGEIDNVHNARLIAAAPETKRQRDDMRAVLEWIEGDILRSGGQNRSTVEIQLVRDVLAKARGGA